MWAARPSHTRSLHETFDQQGTAIPLAQGHHGRRISRAPQQTPTGMGHSYGQLSSEASASLELLRRPRDSQALTLICVLRIITQRVSAQLQHTKIPSKGGWAVGDKDELDVPAWCNLCSQRAGGLWAMQNVCFQLQRVHQRVATVCGEKRASSLRPRR